MKKITELVDQTGTTKQQSGSSAQFNHSKEGMAKAWRALLAMRLQTEEVGSTDFLYWHHGLREFSDQQLMDGVKKARDFDGYLTLGAFREMCSPPKLAPCHKPFKALPKPKWNPKERQATIRAWREKEGWI